MQNSVRVPGGVNRPSPRRYRPSATLPPLSRFRTADVGRTACRSRAASVAIVHACVRVLRPPPSSAPTASTLHTSRPASYSHSTPEAHTSHPAPTADPAPYTAHRAQRGSHAQRRPAAPALLSLRAPAGVRITPAAPQPSFVFVFANQSHSSATSKSSESESVSAYALESASAPAFTTASAPESESVRVRVRVRSHLSDLDSEVCDERVCSPTGRDGRAAATDGARNTVSAASRKYAARRGAHVCVMHQYLPYMSRIPQIRKHIACAR
ncbi:hypothetical protein B0H17DRAFT_1212114 [Mycena rosella]|uniref:Uncharacterized protein n=1 Tax=Mycena rosella TaxID=1033263 RepID=A0AAD7CTC5_MYCRO|nr:hypothetical protein B0H17DRAFT_1212114 [Mycena rosella]